VYRDRTPENREQREDCKVLKEELQKKDLEISKYKNRCQTIMKEWRSKMDEDFEDLSRSRVEVSPGKFNTNGTLTPSFHKSRILQDLSRSVSPTPNLKT
jgi:hypothetical protein